MPPSEGAKMAETQAISGGEPKTAQKDSSQKVIPSGGAAEYGGSVISGGAITLKCMRKE